MMQLNTTGFMHNRLRLVTANFLIKDLHVDWRVGEKYFAQHLIDYDPIVNNGNWQWCSGGGADSQPYFRIFNPQLQLKTYDPQELFVRKYLKTRVEMIVDHDKEKTKTMEYYKKALN
jgi:deoxyribodipyrimidine photo-lyase